MTITYENNTNAGTATASITKGTATAQVQFTISAKAYSSDDITISNIDDQIYTGTAVTPKVTIQDGTKTLTENTDYTLSYSNNTAVGKATVTIEFQGNYSGDTTVEFQIKYATLPGDTTNSTIFADYDTTSGSWSNSDGGVTFTTQDGWTVSTQPGTGYTNSVTFADEGQLTKTVYVKDGDENIYETTISYKLDKTDPAIASDAVTYTSTWSKADVSVTVDTTKVSDTDGSDINRYELWANGEKAYESTNGSFTVSATGSYTLRVYDNAGNYTDYGTAIQVNIDKADPTISVSGHDTNWHNANVPLTITVSDSGDTGSADASGIKQVTVQIDGGAVTDITNTYASSGYTAMQEGEHTYTFTVYDGAGNSASTTVTVKIDKTPPLISAISGNPDDWTNQDVELSFTVTETGGSGIQSVTVQSDNGTDYTTAAEIQLENGEYRFTATQNGTFTVTVTDGANNTDTETVEVTYIDKTKPVIDSISGNPGTWTNKDVTLTLTIAEKGGSGIDQVTVSKDSGEAQNITDTYATGYTVRTAGSYTFTVTDGAGNSSSATVTVHSVTFQSNYGTVPENHVVADGGKVTKPSDPGQTGYAFTAWQQNSTNYDFDSTVSGNITLTAAWTLNAPTVEVENSANGAVTYGTAVTLTAHPEHEAGDGIQFSYQWYKDGQVVPGETEYSITIRDVWDSGSYTVQVTATDGYGLDSQVTSGGTTVTIEPLDITGNWQGLSHVYDGTAPAVTVTLNGVLAGDACTAQVTHDNTNAGSYSVTASLTGTDARNYNLTNETETLVIQKKPVHFVIGAGTVSAGNVPETIVTTTDCDAGDYTVTYWQNGVQVAAPEANGSYEVRVEITDPNYRHADSSSQTVAIGFFTVTNGTPRAYDIRFTGGAAGAADAAEPQQLTAGSILILPECSLTHPEGLTFAGWRADGTGALYQAGDTYTVESRNVTFVAQWQAPISVTGTLLDATEAPVQDAVISLWQGGILVAQTTTDENGGYTFENVPAGNYNLTVSKDIREVTTNVTVTPDGMTGHEALRLPTGATNTGVTQTPGTPNVSVGGLEDLYGDNTVYDPATENPDEERVDLILTVTEKDEVPETIQDAANSSTNLELTLDLDLSKEIGNSGTPESVPSSQALLEIVIDLPADLQGKYAYEVYRELAGEAEALVQNPADGEEGFVVSADKTSITLYVREYTAYTIGYRNRPSNIPNNIPVITEPENGKVTVSPNRPAVGSEMVITAIPDVGYEVGTVTVTDQNGNPVDFVDNGDGTVGPVTVTVTFVGENSATSCPQDETCPLCNYTDLQVDEWYHDGIHYCLEHGLMIGTGADTYDPDIATSRGMVVTILWRMAGMPAAEGGTSFTDVAAGSYYQQAIAWAESCGIAKGFEDGTFRPDEAVTREQLAVFLYRYAAFQGADITGGDEDVFAGYTDADTIGDYAVEAMAWAVDARLIRGLPGDILSPKTSAIRAHTATLLMRYCLEILG